MNIAALSSEVLRLPREQRAQLMDAIRESLDDEFISAEREAELLHELDIRWAAFKDGRMETVDGPASLAALREKYAP